jgi:hypothetical protein
MSRCDRLAVLRWGLTRSSIAAWCAAGLLCALVWCVPPAAAQSDDAGGKSQVARDLFERGKAQWAAGQYEEAVSLLAASNQQVPKAGTAMLLADAYERLGRLRTARDAFRLASQLAHDSGNTQLEHRANTREAALSPRLPLLELRIVPPPPAGLLVTLNGIEIPTEQLNAVTPLDAGNYTLEARAPGYRPFSLQVQLTNDAPQPRGARVIPIQLYRAGESEASAGGAASADSGASSRQLGWWVGGTGAALAVAGAVSMIVSLEANSSSKDHCGTEANPLVTNEDLCDSRGADLRGRAKTFADLATAGAILGLAGIGAGLTIYYTAGNEREPEAAGVGWSAAF